MFKNTSSQCKEHGTHDNIPHPTDMRSDTRPKLSLLNPDDIPPRRKLRIKRSEKKPDIAIPQGQLQLQLSQPKPDVLYISPPTSSSDAEHEISTSSASSTSSETTGSSQDTQYSSSQLHYYRNRDKILTYAKLRYKNNRESLLAYSKQYQSERKSVGKERNVTYYETNRVRLLKDRATKITCECGKVIAKGSLSNHLHTTYHLRHVAAAPVVAATLPPPELDI
jgi:hypothetical protein